MRPILWVVLGGSLLYLTCVPPEETDAGSPDGSSGDGVGEGGIYWCAPGSFIMCMTNELMLRCNSEGTGTAFVSCNPSSCDPAVKSCSGCDPFSFKPTCESGSAVYCTPEGRKIKTSCLRECLDGRCFGCTKVTYYRDADADGYGDPASKLADCHTPYGYVSNSLDCDDLEANAHPGQTTFFSMPTKGGKTYDFDCDKKEQQQYPAAAACTLAGESCTGEGWIGGVPACGKSGQLAGCVKRAGTPPTCSEAAPTAKVQSCR